MSTINQGEGEASTALRDLQYLTQTGSRHFGHFFTLKKMTDRHRNRQL